MKILHLASAVGGNAWGLAESERSIGLNSTVLVAAEDWLKYPADIKLRLEEIQSTAGKAAKIGLTFFDIRNKYDVFHFNFGSSLMHIPNKWKPYLPPIFKYIDMIDLPFYKKKAKLFVTYNGCDARQKFPTIRRASISACKNKNCYGGMCNSGIFDKYRRHSIDKMTRYVEHMWALNPDLLYFLPKDKSSFLPYTISSWLDLDAYPSKFDRKLKIVHAPTNRVAKGSDPILSAIEKIKEDFPNHIEVQLVENVNHEKALKIYREADLVIDQILIGWYGGLAVEAMKLGKPVVARIAKEDLHFIPRQMAKDLLETIISADPFTIEEVLRQCIEERNYLKQHAEASLEYVNRWHNPQYVAGLTKARYESS